MKNTITRKLKLEEMSVVSGGVNINLSSSYDACYRPIIAEIAKGLKDEGFARDEAIGYIYDVYYQFDMKLFGLNEFLTKAYWDSL